MANNVIYTNNGAYVTRVSRGWYEVYQHAGTHAVRKATFHLPDKPEYAYDRARARCDELAGEA